MASIALGRGDVIVGVDTHKDEHVAVALDGLGGTPRRAGHRRDHGRLRRAVRVG